MSIGFDKNDAEYKEACRLLCRIYAMSSGAKLDGEAAVYGDTLLNLANRLIQSLGASDNTRSVIVDVETALNCLERSRKSRSPMSIVQPASFGAWAADLLQNAAISINSFAIEESLTKRIIDRGEEILADEDGSILGSEKMVELLCWFELLDQIST